MPLPEPQREEQKQRFMRRCMGDETMREEFPDDGQRRAVCERQWEKEKGMTVAISGIIGLDVLAGDFREKLEAAESPVDLIINSPGGLVSEGIAVYNAIRDYRRNGGEVNARVVGMAASMSSYIPLAADRVTVEDNAVWMIHNPRSIAIGDQREMQRTARTLEGIAGVLARAYAEKSGAPLEDIRALMDDETYFFGQEIVDAGLADAIEPAGDGTEDRAEAVAMVETAVTHAVNRMKSETTETAEEIAAVAGDIQGMAGGHVSNETRPQAGTQREVPMSQEQKTETPAENAPSYDDGVRAGIEQERARIQRLHKAQEADPTNQRLSEVVAEAVNSGDRYEDVAEKVAVAIRDGGKFDGENPPMVDTAEADHESLTAEERAICDNLGISYDDYKAQKRGEDNQ